MSLFMIEQVVSIYDYFKEPTTNFDPPVILGWGGEFREEDHIRIARGDGDLTEGTGEFDSGNTFYIQGWVFDSNGNKRRESYIKLGVLLRLIIKHIFLWRDLHNEIDLKVSVRTDDDSFAPFYGFQLSIEVTSNHICRVIDQL